MDLRDWLLIAGITITVVQVAVGGYIKLLLGRLENQDKKLSVIETALYNVRLDYVPRVELQNDLARIENKMDRLENKLDQLLISSTQSHHNRT
jgi:hypothetical protein